MLGHNNILSSETIEKIKSNNKTKIALWYEDHLIKGGPNAMNNLNLIEKNLNFPTYPIFNKGK